MARFTLLLSPDVVDFELPASFPEPSAASVDDAAPVPAFERELLELERSFFAQPEPLKWMAGGANAFDIVPSAPHSGQNFGPWSWIPWTTSVRWPQALHV